MAAPLLPLIILGVGAVAAYLGATKKASAKQTAQETPLTVPTGTPERRALAAQYSKEMITAIQSLNADPQTGTISTRPPDAAIQSASSLVARLRADGFTIEAQTLDKLVQAAINMPGAKPATVVPIPGIPADLQALLDNVLKYSKDPTQLAAVADALKKLPGYASGDPKVVNAVQMVEAMAAQLQSQIIAAQALQSVQTTMQQANQAATAIATGAQTPQQVLTTAIPAAVSQASQVLAQTPAAVASPPIMQAPAAKTPVEVAADALVAHLKRIQTSSGSVLKAKGREDTNIVKRYQTLAKLTADGKVGPGTLAMTATHGQYDLPLVMYWPVSSTKTTVMKYRAALENIATKLASTDPVGAAQLRASAARERGQAGIVGAMPA